MFVIIVFEVNAHSSTQFLLENSASLIKQQLWNATIKRNIAIPCNQNNMGRSLPTQDRVQCLWNSAWDSRVHVYMLYLHLVQTTEAPRDLRRNWSRETDRYQEKHQWFATLLGLPLALHLSNPLSNPLWNPVWNMWNNSVWSHSNYTRNKSIQILVYLFDEIDSAS
jgi:hypothetical protein